ncbi:MAG: hypothetical protein RLZZ401_2249, partial [Pseudomonadota bacterium]
MSLSLPTPRPLAFIPSVNRNAVIVAVVIALHLAALWALQNGLMMRAIEQWIPVQIL